MTDVPKWLGFEFRTEGGIAMIVDEDIDEIMIQIDQRTEKMLKADFWEKLGKDNAGYYAWRKK